MSPKNKNKMLFYRANRIFLLFLMLIVFSFSACINVSVIEVGAPKIEYGCWCKNYRTFDNIDKNAVDSWDAICRNHVECYTSGSLNQRPYCDNLYVNQIQEEAAKKNLMPIDIKAIFEHYWFEFYGTLPTDEVYSTSTGRIYFYKTRMPCNESKE